MPTHTDTASVKSYLSQITAIHHKASPLAVTSGTNEFRRWIALRITLNSTELLSSIETTYGSRASRGCARSSLASLKPEDGPSIAEKTGDDKHRTCEATLNLTTFSLVDSLRMRSPCGAMQTSTMGLVSYPLGSLSRSGVPSRNVSVKRKNVEDAPSWAHVVDLELMKSVRPMFIDITAHTIKNIVGTGDKLSAE